MYTQVSKTKMCLFALVCRHRLRSAFTVDPLLHPKTGFFLFIHSLFVPPFALKKNNNNNNLFVTQAKWKGASFLNLLLHHLCPDASISAAPRAQRSQKWMDVTSIAPCSIASHDPCLLAKVCSTHFHLVCSRPAPFSYTLQIYSKKIGSTRSQDALHKGQTLSSTGDMSDCLPNPLFLKSCLCVAEMACSTSQRS